MSESVNWGDAPIYFLGYDGRSAGERLVTSSPANQGTPVGCDGGFSYREFRFGGFGVWEGVFYPLFTGEL